MSIADAVKQCQSTGLTGWDLVEYAQKLVAGNMTYSYFNSFDQPGAAFEKGRGYCWQQAGALNLILTGLGLDSRLVHAVRNRFPDRVLDGVTVHTGVSGHVWCRVRIGGAEKDVCPGRTTNSPGILHFEILSKVKDFRGPITFFSYWGSAAVNRRRGRRFMKQKEMQESLHNPEKCPCRKKSCPRYRKCEECKANHHGKGGLPFCERGLEKQQPSSK